MLTSAEVSLSFNSLFTYFICTRVLFTVHVELGILNDYWNNKFEAQSVLEFPVDAWELDRNWKLRYTELLRR